MRADTTSRGQISWIWQRADWPAFTYAVAQAAPAIAQAREARGRVRGLARAIGLENLDAVQRDVWMSEALATAAIEGEKLELAAVRSSVLRRLGLDDGGPAQRPVEGLVEVMEDAMRGYAEPLHAQRLCRWQAALFPAGGTALRRIATGRFRDHADPMQIVSGPMGREVVHYEAPASVNVPAQMAAFLRWFNQARHVGDGPGMDGIARAAIAHLWFETIHPFEDGNGRVGRAIADMALAQDDGSPVRLYSLSRQLLVERANYYAALANAQRSSMDATHFVVWFANAFARACDASGALIEASLQKSRFWATHARQDLNFRQRHILQRLLADGDGGFVGGLNADKYIKIVKTSKATATRDLGDLARCGLLRTVGQGKALRYYVNVPGWTHGLTAPKNG